MGIGDLCWEPLMIDLNDPYDRIKVFFEGPQNGEDENAHMRRVNSIISENDRALITKLMIEKFKKDNGL